MKSKVKKNVKKIKKIVPSKKRKKSRQNDVFRAMEFRDEQQVVKDMSGDTSIMDELCYHFTQKGKEMYGISWIGAREIAKGRHHISLGEPRVVRTDVSYCVTISAYDKKRAVNFWGASEQPFKMLLKSGVSVPDQFALPKALSKAQRNAVLAIIPMPVIKLAVKKWYEQGKVVELSESDVPKQAIKQKKKNDYKPQSTGQVFYCSDCGSPINNDVVVYSMKEFKLPLCRRCQDKVRKRK